MRTRVPALTGEVMPTRARAVAWQRAMAMATAAPCTKGVDGLGSGRVRVRVRVRVGVGVRVRVRYP